VPTARRRFRFAVCIELIDHAVPDAGDVVFLGRILFRVGHEDVAVEVLDSEGRVAGRQIGVLERAGQQGDLEVLVEDIDLAGPEVRRVEEVAARVAAARQAFVDRAASDRDAGPSATTDRLRAGRLVPADDRSGPPWRR